MRLYVKAPRRQRRQIPGTGVNLEHLITGSATEVVMMAEVRELVAWRFAGEVDGGDLAPFNQAANCPVNCCCA